MVKINQTNDVGQITPHPSASPNKSSITGDFQNVLGDALSKTDKTSSAGAPMGNALEEIPSKTVFIPPSDTIISNKAFVEQTDHLLDLLDRYTAQLENPNVPLKEVAPTIEQMKSSAEELLSQADTNGNLDPQMKQIATEAAVVANKEYLKFQRGDYLS